MEYGACEIIGSGTARNPYRPVVADYGCSFVGVNKGQTNIMFVKFDGGDITGAIADPRVVTLNRPLTDTLTALQANVVNNRLEARFGITSDPITAGMTVKQVYDTILAIVDDTAAWEAIKLGGASE